MRPWLVCILVLAALGGLPGVAGAQSTGGSFGGSRGFGGGGGGSSYGGGGSSYGGGSSSADRARERREADRARREEARRAEQRRQDEARRREQARLEAEAAARRAEAARLEAARLEAERLAREAAELARVRAMAPAERASYPGYFSEPVLPPRPAVHTPSVGAVLTPAPEARGRPHGRRLPRATLYPEERIQPEWESGAIGGALAFVPFVLLGVGFRHRSARKAVRAEALRWQRRGSCEVVRVSLAFAPEVRPALQGALEALSDDHDMSTASGMHAAAREVGRLLAAHAEGARGATWSGERCHPREAEARFQKLTRDLEARYRHDVVEREVDEEFTAKAHEGEGWVVVSIVAGATTTFPSGGERLSRESLAAHLRRLTESATPDQLVAFQAIWSPARELDRMSSAELAMLYPEIVFFDAVPKLARCRYCQTLHAVELDECPSCGAPAKYQWPVPEG